MLNHASKVDVRGQFGRYGFGEVDVANTQQARSGSLYTRKSFEKPRNAFVLANLSQIDEG